MTGGHLVHTVAHALVFLRIAQVEQSRRVCDAVAHGRVDCAIVGGEIPEELRPSLAAEPFAQDELALVVRALGVGNQT